MSNFRGGIKYTKNDNKGYSPSAYSGKHQNRTDCMRMLALCNQQDKGCFSFKDDGTLTISSTNDDERWTLSPPKTGLPNEVNGDKLVAINPDANVKWNCDCCGKEINNQEDIIMYVNNDNSMSYHIGCILTHVRSCPLFSLSVTISADFRGVSRQTLVTYKQMIMQHLESSEQLPSNYTLNEFYNQMKFGWPQISIEDGIYVASVHIKEPIEMKLRFEDHPRKPVESVEIYR